MYTQDECYGGLVELSCGSLRVEVINEQYGRHPDEKCVPSAGDCRVQGDYYKNMVRIV